MMKLLDKLQFAEGVKGFIVLICLLWVIPCEAKEYVSGKDYFELPNTVSGVSDVVEYFSFNCPHCYYFEMKSDINNSIVASFPSGTSFERYHSSHIAPFGSELTRAWAVANFLHKQSEMTPIIFNAMQKSNVVHDKKSLQALFINQGMKTNELTSIWDSTEITAAVNRQDTLASSLGLRFVPAFFVRGKYLVNNMALDTTTDESFEKDYAGIIRYLLNKNQ
ncbi:DsbA family protein [Citrobacter sp. MNAZ 1397]|uniref:DsbA family protein n=1 Tax=Citrobacter sp. MNAZ 1397 TaxID=2911205 RepID=UPI00202690AB|nr:DsbA family protein [Citrobacter sp. MNAZ 1397]MCL9674575.1 DsbA family protein [Citrobacter sp. MNAZ 1397]